MSNETSKAYGFRANCGDFDRYLCGKGIDIGCGADPLRVPKGSVNGWDHCHGDAQLMEGVPDGRYDFVYSSHCLEHMTNALVALGNWARILKPGGYLYVVVPEWTLYEHRVWPSRNNDDHKCSFAVISAPRPAHQHYTVADLSNLPGLKLVDVRLDMQGFRWDQHGKTDQTAAYAAQCQATFIWRKCL